MGQVYVYDTVKGDQDEYDVPPRHQPKAQQDIYDVPPTRQHFNTQVRLGFLLNCCIHVFITHLGQLGQVKKIIENTMQQHSLNQNTSYLCFRCMILLQWW